MAGASSLDVPDDASLEARDAALAAALDRAVQSSGATGAAVTVVRGGELAFSYATGVVRAGDAQVTDQTLFRIGSVGKLMTATHVENIARRSDPAARSSTRL